GLKHSERGFGVDAVALAEEIWKVSKQESLEASIEAMFEAIRSRETNCHVVLSHCTFILAEISNWRRTSIAQLNQEKTVAPDESSSVGHHQSEAPENNLQLGGTFMNYYMYHGGTNFGRTTGGPFVATSYDYDAPLDEYGIIRQPKWGHLKDLHDSIKLSEEALIATDPIVTSLDPNIE
ncbi:hypothetical protein S245_056183, partial [Arachis hypogaea]